MDPYVELALFDPASKETRRQETSHLQNEPNPKWGEKFDFAMVSAPSILTGALLTILPCCCRQAHSCCDKVCSTAAFADPLGIEVATH